MSHNDIENILILQIFQNIINHESDNSSENESIAEDDELITLSLLELSEQRYLNP